MSNQTLSNYKRIFRAIACFVCAMPIGGWLTKNRFIHLFPPLGDVALTGLALTAATILAGISAILPLKLTIPSKRSIVFVPCFILACLSAVSYFYLSQEYVVSIPLPEKSPVTLSIGSVRSQFALEHFKKEDTNADLLRAEGPYEDSVQKLWTPASILSVRLRLFLSYLGLLVPINFIVGVLAKADKASARRR